jgi:hypothetical protein
MGMRLCNHALGVAYLGSTWGRSIGVAGWWAGDRRRGRNGSAIVLRGIPVTKCRRQEPAAGRAY